MLGCLANERLALQDRAGLVKDGVERFFLFLHNYIQFTTVIHKKCFEKIFVGI